MAGLINHEKTFISLFNETARYHRRARVFEDFVSCSVIALENRLCFCQKREDKGSVAKIAALINFFPIFTSDAPHERI